MIVYKLTAQVDEIEEIDKDILETPYISKEMIELDSEYIKQKYGVETKILPVELRQISKIIEYKLKKWVEETSSSEIKEQLLLIPKFDFSELFICTISRGRNDLVVVREYLEKSTAFERAHTLLEIEKSLKQYSDGAYIVVKYATGTLKIIEINTVLINKLNKYFK